MEKIVVTKFLTMSVPSYPVESTIRHGYYTADTKVAHVTKCRDVYHKVVMPGTVVIDFPVLVRGNLDNAIRLIGQIESQLQLPDNMRTEFGPVDLGALDRSYPAEVRGSEWFQCNPRWWKSSTLILSLFTLFARCARYCDSIEDCYQHEPWLNMSRAAVEYFLAGNTTITIPEIEKKLWRVTFATALDDLERHKRMLRRPNMSYLNVKQRKLTSDALQEKEQFDHEIARLTNEIEQEYATLNNVIASARARITTLTGQLNQNVKDYHSWRSNLAEALRKHIESQSFAWQKSPAGKKFAQWLSKVESQGMRLEYSVSLHGVIPPNFSLLENMSNFPTQTPTSKPANVWSRCSHYSSYK